MPYNPSNLPFTPSNLEHLSHPQTTWNMLYTPSNLKHALHPKQPGTFPPSHAKRNMPSTPYNQEHALHQMQPEMALYVCITQQKSVISLTWQVWYSIVQMYLIIHVVTINIRLFAFTNYFSDL